MEATLLHNLLTALPESQHDLLRRRVEWAEREGWRYLGLWAAPGDEADVSDLVGVPPGERCVAFLVHTEGDWPEE